MINSLVLSGIMDRIAGESQQLKAGINSGMGMGTKLYPRIHRGSGTDGDYSVENALITAAHGIDVNTISGTLFREVFGTFVQALENHALDARAVSFDSYLNISGINAHTEFEDVWYQSKGIHLDAVNVFFPDANILVANYQVTTSGAGTYTSNNPIGTGTGKVSVTNHAAAKFLLVPIQSIISGVQINLRLLKEDGQSSGTIADSANIAITSGVISGTQFPINWNNLNSGNYYLDCNNIVALGGYNNDVYRVYATRERDLVL